MSIRIGSSCALSIPMAIGNVIETRILTDNSTYWQDVCKFAISNNKYLILTPCVNNGYNEADIPDNIKWKDTINKACIFLKSIGGNKYNCRFSLVNEPLKWFSREDYAYYIDLAYPIIKSYGFLCGAGNEEFIMSDVFGHMYQYILTNCKFDILDIHIQGSCDTKEKTKARCEEVLTWKNYWNKPVDCTEAFYGDISTSSGWELLQYQCACAETILHCDNFCNVFNNLQTNMFPVLSDSETLKAWTKISFKVNGVLRSNYCGHWKILMDVKAPVPNIKIVEELDDMKLSVLKPGSKGNQVLFLQEILETEYGFENPYLDGIYGSMTLQQVKAYQTANNLEPDGFVGKFTMADLISKSENPNYWMNKLQVYMAYE